MDELEKRNRLADIKREEKKEIALHEIEQKSPFRDFIQMNKEYMPHIIKACGENNGAMRLFFFLLMHMDKYNALMCPYKTFEQRLGMSQPTVARCIKYLKDKNLIYVEKTSTCNMYVVSSYIAWSSKGTLIKYCQFPGAQTPCVTNAEEGNKLRKKGKTMRVTIVHPDEEEPPTKEENLEE